MPSSSMRLLFRKLEKKIQWMQIHITPQQGEGLIMGKEVMWRDYQVAYQVMWRNGEIPITDCQFDREIILGEHAFYPPKTPEKIFLKKEMVQNLSDEAKEVIWLVLNSPPEVMAFFSSSKTTVNKRKLMDFLIHRKHWPWKKARETFEELKIFLAKLSD